MKPNRRSSLAAAGLAAVIVAAAPSHAAQTRACVLTSDYTNGAVSAADLATRAVTRDVATVYSDARIRCFGGRIYVVNRLGQDNVQVIDPTAGFATIEQFSVGNGSNPQDIAFVSPTKAYVTRLASPRLLIVNPVTGDSTGAISLAAFADADHVPDMDRMIVVGSRLFVALERLANFQPTDTSVVVAVDTDADTVIDAAPGTPGVQPIVLPGTNPTTKFDVDPVSGRLLIGCTGQYGAADGGIDWIDPETLASGGFAITEAALGGDVLDVVWGSATRSFAIVSDAGYNTSLVAWDPTTGQKLETLFSPGGFYLADAELDDRGELYVCDNAPTAPGLYVLSAASGAVLAGPLDTGLPPVEAAFDTATVESPVAPSTLLLAAPWPQPAKGDVHARLTLDRAAPVLARVFDLEGRRVRTLLEGEFPAGPLDLAWDTRDDSGRRVASGIYVLQARAGATSRFRRVVVTK